MAHHVEAVYDEEDNMFLPPRRTLGFNPKLTMNDSLLVQSYVEAYDLSYPEALRRIEEEVTELRQHLENEGSYEMNDIGVLALNEDGNLVFTPCEAGILTPALYGLSSFEMRGLAVAEPPTPADTTAAKVADADAPKEEPQETEAEQSPIFTTDDDDDDKTIEIKMSWVRNAVAVAAAVLAFFLMTTPVINSDNTGRNIGHLHNPVLKSFTVKDTNMQKVIISNDADSMEMATTPAPAVEQADTAKAVPQQEPAQEKSEGYTIVLASYITLKNANAFVEQLHKKGFNDAEVFVRNHVTRVILGNFSSENNAYNHLRTLRGKKDFEEAWVMEI